MNSPKRSLALVVTFLIVGIGFGQAQAAKKASTAPAKSMSNASPQDEITKTEKGLWEAFKKKDAKPFQENLSKDFSLISSSGVSDRAKAINDIVSPDCSVKGYTLGKFSFTKLGNDAMLVTYEAHVDGTCSGQKIPPTVFTSSVYVKEDGKWKGGFHQETEALPPPPPPKKK